MLYLVRRYFRQDYFTRCKQVSFKSHASFTFPLHFSSSWVVQEVMKFLVAVALAAAAAHTVHASLQSCLQSQGVSYLDSSSGQSWSSAKTPFNKR